MSRSLKNKVYDINLVHVLCLVPLILFSYYKNGFLVYREGYMSFFSSLQYIIIPLVIVTISYIFEIYYYVGIKKDRNLNNVINSFSPYANLLCYLLCGPNDALYIIVPLIFIIDVLMKWLDKKITINRVALFKCLLFVILALFGLYNNANTYERIIGINVFNNMESFLGTVIGEIGTVSNLLIILSFIVLLFNRYYKKDIVFIVLITYLLFGGFFVLVDTISFNQLITNTLNSGLLFAVVFVLPLSEASPALKGGRTIYSVLFGILVAIFVNIFELYIGIYFIILFMSLIAPAINKLKISIYK